MDAWFYGGLGGAPVPWNPSLPTTAKSIQAPFSIFWHAVIRGRTLYAAHYVRKTDGPWNNDLDPANRLVIQWYEFSVSQWPDPTFTHEPVLLDWGIIDPDAFPGSLRVENGWATDPSMAINTRGDVVMTFTVSSTEVYPSIWRAIHWRTSPPGFTDVGMVRLGITQHEFGAQRWQDFVGADPDPLDWCLFYAHNVMAFDNDEPPGTIPPAENYQSWLTMLNLCADDGWADFNGDNELNSWDAMEFNGLMLAGDERADVNADKSIDAQDALLVGAALNGK